MVTIFTTPRAFRGHFGVIQRNAMLNWLQLEPRPQILVLGNDEGTAEVCRELGLTHIPDVACNEFGTPLFDSMLEKAEALAQYDLMLMLSSDIILPLRTMDFIGTIQQRFGDQFCAVARRYNVGLNEVRDFSKRDWDEWLAPLVQYKQNQNLVAGDFFLFPKGFFANPPGFSYGRCFLDTWMFYKTIAKKAALVDLSNAFFIYHQTHDYSHHPKGRAGVYGGDEWERNNVLYGGWRYRFSIQDANWFFDGKTFKPAPITFSRLRLRWKRLPVLKPGFAKTHERIVNLLKSPRTLFKKLTGSGAKAATN